MFANAGSACALIAGLPAAARAARAVADAGLARCAIMIADGSEPDEVTRAETQRLVADGEPEWLKGCEFGEALPSAPTLLIPGEWLVPAEAIRALLVGGAGRGGGMVLAPCPGDPDALAALGKPEAAASYSLAARRIVTSTAKPGDGIVSRHLNRPVSQAISRQLLRFGAIRPGHATMITALLAVVMFAALLSGTTGGLIGGALLFQAASIFDGVDGEIARATFRATPQGARLDSLVDAFTNLACIGGVALNLYFQGESAAALAGGAGLALLASGLATIAWGNRGRPGGLTFNAVKEHFSARGSALLTVLTWLTSRDFFALAGALLILAGFAPLAMYALAVVASGWLVVVLAVTMRHST